MAPGFCFALSPLPCSFHGAKLHRGKYLRRRCKTLLCQLACSVYVSGGRGLGTLTAKALEHRGEQVLRDRNAALASTSVTAAVFAIGAGAADTELDRWREAVRDLQFLPAGTLGLFVVRSLSIQGVVTLLSGMRNWVVVRPGAFVPEPDGREIDLSRRPVADDVLLTDDVGANGVISREKVAVVLAHLAVLPDAADGLLGGVVGVYDWARMVSTPPKVRNLLPGV